MIQPANRISQVKEYYFSQKLRAIDLMNTEGKDVINLGVGSPDKAPSNDVRRVLSEEASKEDTHAYQSYIGIPELRQSFATWYKKYFNVVLNPETEIQPLIGSKEGVLHVSMAFLNPGDEVLIPNPGYPTYSSVSELVGAKVRYFDLKESLGWFPDLEELEKQDLSRVKLMWINYPNMPTGTPASIPVFERLIAFAKKHDILLVNDNPYSFVLNEKPVSILSIEGAKDVCIELNSLSKSHNMAGWRIGMVAANSTFIKYILRVKSNVDSGMFRPLQLAASEALSATQDWYIAMNTTYRNRRKLLEELLVLLHCDFDPHQQGLFLWAKVSKEHESGEALSEYFLKNADVFITPGFIFGSNGEQFIRLSLCTKSARIREAIARIKNIH